MASTLLLIMSWMMSICLMTSVSCAGPFQVMVELQLIFREVPTFRQVALMMISIQR